MFLFFYLYSVVVTYFDSDKLNYFANIAFFNVFISDLFAPFIAIFAIADVIPIDAFFFVDDLYLYFTSFIISALNFIPRILLTSFHSFIHLCAVCILLIVSIFKSSKITLSLWLSFFFSLFITSVFFYNYIASLICLIFGMITSGYLGTSFSNLQASSSTTSLTFFNMDNYSFLLLIMLNKSVSCLSCEFEFVGIFATRNHNYDMRFHSD